MGDGGRVILGRENWSTAPTRLLRNSVDASDQNHGLHVANDNGNGIYGTYIDKYNIIPRLTLRAFLGIPTALSGY